MNSKCAFFHRQENKVHIHMPLFTKRYYCSVAYIHTNMYIQIITVSFLHKYRYMQLSELHICILCKTTDRAHLLKKFSICMSIY